MNKKSAVVVALALLLAAGSLLSLRQHRSDECSQLRTQALIDDIGDAWNTGFGLFGHSGLPTQRLKMGKINERIQIHFLRFGDADPFTLEDVYKADPVPMDEWGTPFVLVIPGPDEHAFDLVSLGSDKLPGNRCNLPDARDRRWSDD